MEDRIKLPRRVLANHQEQHTHTHTHTHTHRDGLASYQARHWPDHREQLEFRVLLKDTLACGQELDQTTNPAIMTQVCLLYGAEDDSFT